LRLRSSSIYRRAAWIGRSLDGGREGGREGGRTQSYLTDKGSGAEARERVTGLTTALPGSEVSTQGVNRGTGAGEDDGPGGVQLVKGEGEGG